VDVGGETDPLIDHTHDQERTDLTKELDQLKKGQYFQPSESIALEEFQKNDEERQQREQEIQREIEKQEIVNDENRPSAERERARENKKELEHEQNEIENERESKIEQLPLRDRLREKVKSIFKKYGHFACSRNNHLCYSQLALKWLERGCQRCRKRP